MSSQARHISPLIISYSLIHTASKERGGEVLEAPSKKESLNFVHVTLGQNIMTLSVKIKTLVYKISGVFQELNKIIFLRIIFRTLEKSSIMAGVFSGIPGAVQTSHKALRKLYLETNHFYLHFLIPGLKVSGNKRSTTD